MNLTEEARRLLTCGELRGRVPQEVQEFLRVVAGLELAGWRVSWSPFADSELTKDRNRIAKIMQLATPPNINPLYTLDCVATTGCKATTEKMEPRHASE